MGDAAVTEPAEEHRCERGPRCAGRQPDEHGGWQASVCGRDLCDHCETQIADALDQAAVLYVQLRAATLTGHGTATIGEFVTRSKGSPLPLNARALHLGEELHWLLTTWEDVVRDVAGLSLPDRDGKREGRQVADAARLLAAWLPAWLSAPAQEFRLTRTFDNGDPGYHLAEQCGWQAAVHLLDWRNTVRNLPGLDVKAPKAVRRYTQPCPGCGVRAVTHRAGDDLMQCQNCRATQPYLPTLPREADYQQDGAA